MLLNKIKKGENKRLELENSFLFYENSNYFVNQKKYRIISKNQRKSSEKPANLTNQEKIIYSFVIKNNKIDLKTIEKLLHVKSARVREVLSR